MSQSKHFPVPGDSSVYSFVPQLKPVFRQGAQGDVIDSLTRICTNILQAFSRWFRNFLIFIAYNAEPFILVCGIGRNNRNNYISFETQELIMIVF